MSTSIPTTAELYASLIADYEAEYGGSVPIYRKAFLRVVSKVTAGFLAVAYRYGGYIALQMFPQFADTNAVTINGKQIVPLVALGRLYGASDPSAAVRAEYVVNISVINQTGSLPVNTQIKSAVNGVTYLTLAAVALDAATVQATIRAYSDEAGTSGKGAIGNLSVSDELEFVNSQANVEQTVTVDSEVTRGVDAEDWEDYRQRAIDRFRMQPQGGAYTDYELWSEEESGIINVYPYTGLPGVVNVYSEATPESCGNADGIPTTAQLAAVKALIEYTSGGLASRRPVSAFVNSLAITRGEFDIEVYDLQVNAELRTTVKTKIEESLTSYFLSRAPYIPGLTLGARRDRVTQSAIAGLVQDVADAYGAFFTGVRLYYASSQVALYSLAEGQKAKLGTCSIS